MITVKIKPLSVNEAWRGRRFKTDEYKTYEHSLHYLLPKKIELPVSRYFVVYTFGLSSAVADWDNCIKQFQDIIAKKYGFNDKFITGGIVLKKIVPKGQEYISFKITSYDQEKIDLFLSTL